MRLIGSIGFFAILVVLAALFAGTPAAQTEGAASSVETNATVRARVPVNIPAAERARKNPNPVDAASLKRGSELFATQCAMCHGSNGNGRTELSQALGLKVPDFTRATTQQGRTEGELFYVLERGHGSMPSHERLPEDLRWDMIAHVRTLAKK